MKDQEDAHPNLKESPEVPEVHHTFDQLVTYSKHVEQFIRNEYNSIWRLVVLLQPVEKSCSSGWFK